MSEICSHNQLSMTKYQLRTYFCKIETDKRPKYVISIFHMKLRYSQFAHIIPDFTMHDGDFHRIPTSQVVVTHAGHCEMCLHS